ncbi:c-type cytochrome [Sorangium sp. So ce1151]|uniref:c-type cytochrome n=1 Tax=Sorangium sp. So ce1151 TaxID=3133332 RepID=UPI003F5FC5BF
MRVRTILLFCLAPFAIGALQGCGGSDEPGDNNNNNNGGTLGECPDNADAQVMAGFTALTDNCSSCHATDKTGISRYGAPDSLNVDDPATVSAEAEEIYERVMAGTMPPGTKLPDPTVESIRVYLACDAQ